jgi:hypothetical protein
VDEAIAEAVTGSAVLRETVGEIREEGSVHRWLRCWEKRPRESPGGRAPSRRCSTVARSPEEGSAGCGHGGFPEQGQVQVGRALAEVGERSSRDTVANHVHRRGPGQRE